MAPGAPIPVLMVDDRPENLAALAALLSDFDPELELVAARSGDEGLRHCLKRDFALILLDVQMPDMDGMEMAALLRSAPRTRQLPIIFVTAGMGLPSHQFKGYELGAVDYLVKPIDAAILRSKVKVFCQLYQQRMEIEQGRLNLEQAVVRRTAELQAEIDAHRLTEAALADSEQRMRCVIDSANEAFIGMDTSGCIFDWNRQAESMFGWSRDEVLQRPVSGLIIPQRYRQAHEDGMRRFQASGVSAVLNQRIELSAQRRSGEEFPVELSIWRIPHVEQRMFGAFVRDITERKRAVEQLRELNEELETRVQQRSEELRRAMDQIVESEKLASLGGIVAGVAHELNTPIGNIVTMASALEARIEEFELLAGGGTMTRRQLAAHVQECQGASAILVRSALRASELIESFKKVAVDQTSARRRQFDLHDTVRDIAHTLGTAMRHARVALEIRIPPGIRMDGFPGDLEQILSNLIMNSLHHGFEGRGGNIVIDGALAGDRVQLVYADDGAGIAPELHRKVFEPFYTTKLGQGGSGLGMFIVHNLTHGGLKGDIHLDSEAGKGVRFTLTLPLVVPARHSEAEM